MPTLRWIFQLLDGIEIVKIRVDQAVHVIISGLAILKQRILCHFGSSVKKIYGIDDQSALPC